MKGNSGTLSYSASHQRRSFNLLYMGSPPSLRGDGASSALLDTETSPPLPGSHGAVQSLVPQLTEALRPQNLQRVQGDPQNRRRKTSGGQKGLALELAGESSGSLLWLPSSTPAEERRSRLNCNDKPQNICLPTPCPAARHSLWSPQTTILLGAVKLQRRQRVRGQRQRTRQTQAPRQRHKA